MCGIVGMVSCAGSIPPLDRSQAQGALASIKHGVRTHREIMLMVISGWAMSGLASWIFLVPGINRWRPMTAVSS